MPNHVDIDLKVSGEVEALKAFASFAQESSKHDDEKIILLSANKFIPYPKEYADADKAAYEWEKNKTPESDWKDRPKDGFNSGGYEWRLKNWGTKWGIYDAHMVNSKLDAKKGWLKYNCNSAWSPPNQVIEAMGKKFPTLKFSMKYYESGMGFKGTFVMERGEVVKDEYTEGYKGRRGG